MRDVLSFLTCLIITHIKLLIEFWENWYVIGENDPNQLEFKFTCYNGKTSQNTCEGAFACSRTPELDPIIYENRFSCTRSSSMNNLYASFDDAVFIASDLIVA